MVTVRCMYCGSEKDSGAPSLEGVTCGKHCANRVREGVIMDTPEWGDKKAFRIRWRGRLQWSCKMYYHGQIDKICLENAVS